MLPRSDPLLHFNRGLCFQRLERWDSSVADFGRVIALNPSFDHKAYTLRAKALMHLQRWEECAADCEAALRIAPADLQARGFLDFAQQHMRAE